jgi:hypothetical protein
MWMNFEIQVLMMENWGIMGHRWNSWGTRGGACCGGERRERESIGFWGRPGRLPAKRVGAKSIGVENSPHPCRSAWMVYFPKGLAHAHIFAELRECIQMLLGYFGGVSQAPVRQHEISNCRHSCGCSCPYFLAFLPP